MMGPNLVGPIQLLEVELSGALEDVPALPGGHAGRAWSLVRLHTQPLGMVDLTIGPEGLSAAEYARQVWQALHVEIAEHRRRDGLPAVSALDRKGLPGPEMPTCLHARQQFLANAPFVTVIVPTRDRPQDLAVCLSSLQSQDYPNFEVIVVDNSSSPSAAPSLATEQSRQGPEVRSVRAERKGLSHARNRGLMEARGEVVAFVDDDAVPDRHWLTELVKGFGADAGVAAVTGLVVPSQLETPAQLWFELYAGFGKGCTSRLFDLKEHKPANPLFPYAAAMFGSGNNMAFRTSVLRRLGGFDPTLGAGAPARAGEDLAMFYRVISHGYRILYEPAAIVRHAHRRSAAELRDQIHAYGVGLTAYLTSAAIDDPMMLVRLAARMPAGISYFLKSRSSSDRKRQAVYPRELARIELQGMLRGPFAYLRGRFLAANPWRAAR